MDEVKWNYLINEGTEMPYTIALLFLLLYLTMCQILPLKADVKLQDLSAKNDIHRIADEMVVKEECDDRISH